MLKHIVLFKLKEHAEGAGKAQNVRAMKDMIEALKAKIPQIRHIEVGTRMVPAGATFDVAIYSEFADEHDLALYANHPEHVAVVDFVKKVVENRVVADYLI
jgi:antibiotic biosynthesis monooxygenase (ABM) superfamily enzyme